MNFLTLCQFKGGSHSYGLDTPQSDVDYRGVYANTDRGDIVGITSGVHDNITKQNERQDIALWELRRFLRLLQSGNTQAVELLFINRSLLEEIHFAFEPVLESRLKLFDSDKLFKVLKGYSQSELLLANGERTGKLGGKRQEAVAKYGFSPKNFVQLFRLLWAGAWLYREGVFPVCVRAFDQNFADFLMRVKCRPQDFMKQQLNDKAAVLEALLDQSYNSTKVHYQFDTELANQLCYDIYMPILREWKHPAL